MALTKISRSLLDTGVSDSSDATAITIDSSENITTSGTFQVGASSGANLLIDSSSDVMQVKVKKDGTDDVDLAFLTQASGGTLAEKMRIASTGKVGIGTTSPGFQLEVVNTHNPDGSGIYADAANQLHLKNTSTTDNASSGMIYSSGAGAGVLTSALFPNADTNREAHFIISTANSSATLAERVRITSDGKLGIGTTAPDEKLQVNGKLKVSSSFGTNTAVIIQNNDSSDNYSAAAFYSGGTLAGYIFVNGSTNATSYVTSSDYRLKENINYEFDALDRVKQLKPARFNFIADAETTLDGFLAHEVSDIVPEAITGEKDGEEMQGIDLSKLVPLLTKAIQEQQTQIEELRQKIETLKN